MSTHSQMKDHTFSVPCMIITDFVMEARPFFESQIKIKDSSRYLLSKIPVLQQSAVGSSLVGEFSLCAGGTGLKKESLRSTMKKLTSVSGEPTSPYDINSADFDADMYGM